VPPTPESLWCYCTYLESRSSFAAFQNTRLDI
jgi:hypothetical protein